MYAGSPFLGGFLVHTVVLDKIPLSVRKLGGTWLVLCKSLEQSHESRLECQRGN